MENDANKTVFSELMGRVEHENKEFKPEQQGETEQVFLARMLEAISKLSDESWTSLSPATQEWYNLAAAAANKLQLIPTCPGYQTSFPAVEGDKAAEVVPPPTPPVSAKRGIMQRARMLTLDNPQITSVALTAALKAEGWEKISEDTVWICITEVRNVMKAAEMAGYHFLKVQSAQ